MKNKIFKSFILGTCLILLTAIALHVSARTDLAVLWQTESVTVNEGETATVRVVTNGEGLTYKWYYKNAGSSKYRLTTTFTSDTYSISMTDERAGRSVYCVITDKSGNSVKSQAVTLNMRKPLKIISQPKSATVKKGASAKVTVSAQGTNLTYKWYYRNAGQSGFTLTDSFKGNIYSVTMTDARNGRSIYCVITDDQGNSVMTDVVSINMRSLKIIEQPRSVTAVEGEKATVKVTAQGTNLSYKWYVKNAGETQYTLVESITGSTYSATMTSATSGQFVYCVITDPYGNKVQTDTVFLLMQPHLGPVITKQPQDAVCSIGETAQFHVIVDARAPHYMWQYSTDGINWTDLNQTGSICSLSADEAAFSRMYRCLVWDDYGCTYITEAVRLIEKSTLILTQPQNWVGSLSGTAYFRIDVSSSVVSCQWQFSSNGGKTWKDCGSTEVFYSTTATQTRCGYLYRCVVKDAEGRTQISNTVTIAVDDAFAITLQPQNTSARLGQEVVFCVQATGTNLKFKWQRSDDGKSWSTFGTTKSWAVVALTKNSIGKYYRCVITNGDGETLTTDAVQLKWVNTGFFVEDGKKYYVKEDGRLASGITQIDGEIYLFTDSGVMQTGLQKKSGKWYYFTANGTAAIGFTYIPQLNGTLYFNSDGTAATGWTEVDGKTYYFYESGVMARGVTQIGSNEYYFDPQTGAQTLGIVPMGLNNYMYFQDATKPYTGLKKANGKLYYFALSGDNRGITQSEMQTVDGNTYYFDPITKTAVTGFVNYKEKLYYFSSDYTMVKNKLIVINGNTYYFNSDGQMQYGLVRMSGKCYYFDPATGAATAGWINANGHWLYFDPITFEACASETVTINGIKYMFNSNSHLMTGVRESGGTYYYFSEPNKAKTGFIEINSRKYYVNKDQTVAIGLNTIDGKVYYFNATGVMQTGWRKVNNAYYFFKEKDGVAQSGWQTVVVGGNVYKAYTDPKTFRAVTGLQKIDGKLYHFRETGLASAGKRKVNGVAYYFSPVTFEAYTGWVENADGSQSYFDGANGQLIGSGYFNIDGKTYYINSSGIRKKDKATDPKQHELACTWGTIGSAKCYYGMDGKPVTGLCIIDYKLYYFDANGKMKTGLQKANGAYYYFTNTGAITGTRKTNGKIYYFSPYTCKRLYGIQLINDAHYYYNKNGVRVTGLVEDGTSVYYYDPGTGARVTGFVTVDDKQYYFDPVTGKAQTGMQEIDGMYYFFDPQTAERKFGLQKANGKLYCFTDNTAESGLERGLTVVNQKTYYFSAYNGVALSGYREVDGVKYYFDPSTFAAVSGIRRIPNGTAYLFKSTGGIQYGWQTVEGKIYYFYPTTGAMAERLASAGSHLYYFDYNEGLLRNTNVTVAGITYKLDEDGHATALGSTNLAQVINTGITYFEKGYGDEGNSEDPENVTCSQLISKIYESIGVTLPVRSCKQYAALMQEYQVELIDSIAQAKPGDLIFYTTVNCNYSNKCDFWGEIHHVTMYMGDGKIIGSYDIKGDTENNGPMVKDLIENSPSATIYAIVRLRDISE